jgi:hypothetical protein
VDPQMDEGGLPIFPPNKLVCASDPVAAALHLWF